MKYSIMIFITYKKNILFLMFALFIFFSCSDNVEANDEPIVPPVEGGEYVPEEEIGIDDDIKIKVKSGKASEFHAGMNIDKSFDGNYETYYRSLRETEGGGEVWPVVLEYELERPSTLDYILYYPRKGRQNGNIQEVDVSVMTAERGEYKLMVSTDLKGSTNVSRINIPRSENVIKVKFEVNSGIANCVNCGEMEFYSKASLGFDMLSYFTDMTCSELKSDITEKTINEIPNTFFKNIALHLFNGTYPVADRVMTAHVYKNPNVLAKEWKTGTYSLRENPTGIQVNRNTELVVLVGELKGKEMKITIQNLDEGFTKAVTYPLSEGVNKIQTLNSGLAYIHYYTEDGIGDDVKVHIPNGNINGVFRKGNSDLDFTRLLKNAKDKHIDMIGDYAHLTFPVSKLSEVCKSGEGLLSAYDDMVRLEQELMGLEKYGRTAKNHLYFNVNYKDGAYMHAAENRSEYHLSTIDRIANLDELKTESCWGPAHECGHIHQLRPGFKWAGMTEVSNNVFSLYVQTSWGNVSRLENKGKVYNNSYEEAYNAINVTGMAHIERVGEHFVKLVPFWQLYLYYASVLGKKDFYPNLLEIMRTSEDPVSYGLSQLNFIRVACDVVKEDLTDFFKFWGLLKPIKITIDDYGDKDFEITQSDLDNLLTEIKAKKYPKPKYALQFIRDNNVDVFKQGGGVTSGTYTIVGTKIIVNEAENAVAYKVYENSVLKFIGNEKEFTIPAGLNNVKVFAVSVNGNETELINQ